MAKVILLPPVGADLFGGRGELEVEGKTLFALVHALDREGPGFAQAAETRLALAVDGVLAEDWSIPVRPDSEVLVVPKVAGGT